jgi:hypothetical protein
LDVLDGTIPEQALAGGIGEEFCFILPQGVTKQFWKFNALNNHGNGSYIWTCEIKLFEGASAATPTTSPSVGSPRTSAPTLAPSATPNTSPSLDWDLVEGSNMMIGPGSYYFSDPLISLVDDQVTNEVEAHQFIIQYESGPDYNPIVMWQIRDGIFTAHRLRFMSQNLDASSGGSPKGFLNDIKTWLTATGRRGNDVHVRTDKWWSLYG